MCLNLARELAKRQDLRLLIVAIEGGELEADFASLATFHVLDEDHSSTNPETALRTLIAGLDMPVWSAICHTVVCAGLVELLDNERIPVVDLAHELPTDIAQHFGRDRSA